MDRPVSRRNFIVWYLAGLLTAVVVAIVAPLVVFIYPPVGDSKKQNLKVTLDRALSSLKDGEAVKFEAPQETGFIMKDGGGQNAPGKIAFSGYAAKIGENLTVLAVTCSHLGCSVQLNQDSKRYDCPCHGSRFHIDGTVERGPATAALSHLTWKQGTSPTEILVYGIGLKGVG